MALKQSILGFVDSGREVRRPPLVGMQFLHERAMGTPNLVLGRPRLQAKDLIGLLLRHFPGRRSSPAAAIASAAPCPIALRVLTPGGKAAVKIAFQKRQTLDIERRAHR